MYCQWIKKSPSFSKGITSINVLEDTKFEQFLRRIVAKLKLQDTELFSIEERQKLINIFKIDEESLLLSIKTVLYLYKRILKFVFMPTNLKNDLKELGLSNEKSDIFVKVWSTETRTTLEELGSEIIDGTNEPLNFTWNLNAELSSDYHKKSKVPKAYLSFYTENDKTNLELTHNEIYSVFMQFESIQNELDNLI